MFLLPEHIFVERALGQAGTTTTEASQTTTSSDSGFTSSSNDSTDSDNSGYTKNALEWAFAIAALLLVMIITVWRYSQIRRRNFERARRSSTRGNPGRTFPRTTGIPRSRTRSSSSMARNMIAVRPTEEALFYPPSLVHGRYPVPLEPDTARIAPDGAQSERRGRRAATGADIDSNGRRAGGRPGGEDAEDDWDDKEILPAYQSVAVAGPPQYAPDSNNPFIVTMPEPVLAASDVFSRHRTDVATERDATLGVSGDHAYTPARDTPHTPNSTNIDRQGIFSR